MKEPVGATGPPPCRFTATERACVTVARTAASARGCAMRADVLDNCAFATVSAVHSSSLAATRCCCSAAAAVSAAALASASVRRVSAASSLAMRLACCWTCCCACRSSASSCCLRCAVTSAASCLAAALAAKAATPNVPPSRCDRREGEAGTTVLAGVGVAGAAAGAAAAGCVASSAVGVGAAEAGAVAVVVGGGGSTGGCSGSFRSSGRSLMSRSRWPGRCFPGGAFIPPGKVTSSSCSCTRQPSRRWHFVLARPGLPSLPLLRLSWQQRHVWSGISGFFSLSRVGGILLLSP